MLRVDLEDRVFANLLNDEEASWVRVVVNIGKGRQ